MKNRDIAQAWARRQEARTANLVSDGRSLFSFCWYEIGRHVGSGLAFVRHHDERYGARTCTHMSFMRSCAHFENIRTIAVRGENGGGVHTSHIGQPDWSWLSLCHWFDRWLHKNDNAWPGRDFLVSILLDVEFNRRKPGHRVLAFAQQRGDILQLVKLCEDYPGYGKVLIRHTLGGGQRTSEVAVPLDYLKMVYPSAPPSYQVAAKCREDPRWWNNLFWDAQVDDIRKKDWVGACATDRGRPPEPILPFWRRDG